MTSTSLQGGCTCPPCSLCDGKGTVAVDMRGNWIPHRLDDLDGLETCEDCGGSGCAAECDHCRVQREQDEAEDDQSRL
jgi:hypothetical protein